MKKYENYKDSGIEWIGEIPEHWVLSKIGYLAAKIGDGLHGTPKYVDDSEYFFINGNNIGNGIISITDQTKKVSEEEFLRNRKNLSSKTILMSINGTIGNLSFYASEKVMLGKSVAYINCKETVSKDFVYYYLMSEVNTTYINRELSGSTIKNLSLYSINKNPISIPPFLEQTQIANYLDHKCTQIDELISKKERLIQLLEEERTAVINQAVTKGLDPTVPMKDSGIDWLGEIPAHWEVKKIKYLGEIINGFAFKSDDFVEKSTCRVMKISNIQTMRIDWSDDSYLPDDYFEKHENFQIKKGDLVFALTRPIISTGIKASIVEDDERILLNQRNAVLKPFPNLDLKWMFYLIFNSSFIEHFESLIDSTGQQPNISATDIANISIPLPSLFEQNIICKKVDQELEQIFQRKNKIENEITLLKEYKRTLISEVVTGKVDVRDEILN